jgi:hypothetical protein
MLYSEIIQFCLANVSRNDRMASRLHEPGLKARYTESANHWRRLAEQIKEAYPISLPTLVLHHSVEHRDTDHKQVTRLERLQVENLGTAHDAAVNSVTEIEARRDPLTGEWDAASFGLSGGSTDTALAAR